MSTTDNQGKWPAIRITVRDGLWLIVVVVFGVAWWLERRELQSFATFANNRTLLYIAAIGDAAVEWSRETNREIEVKLPDVTLVAKPDGRVLRKYPTKEGDDD